MNLGKLNFACQTILSCMQCSKFLCRQFPQLFIKFLNATHCSIQLCIQGFERSLWQTRLLCIYLKLLTCMSKCNKVYTCLLLCNPHCIIKSLPLAVITFFGSNVETQFQPALGKPLYIAVLEVSPWFKHRNILFEHLYFALPEFNIGIYGIYSFHYCCRIGNFTCGSALFRSKSLKTLDRTLILCRSDQKSLKFRSVGSTTVLLDNMHYPNLTQTFKESGILLVIHKKCQFIHLSYHAVTSSLCSRSDLRIFCDDFDRFSSSSMKRLILRMAS